MAADGFLTRTISRVRTFTDEPSSNAKYTDAKILDLVESSWADVLEEINRNASAPVRVRHDLAIDTATGLNANTYILPPTIGRLFQIDKVDSNGNVEWTIVPRSPWNPAGPAVLLEGNCLTISPDWGAGSYTLRLTYMPVGDVRLHEGTIAASAITNDATANTCAVMLASSPDTGSLDTRPNAYAGSVLRILGDGGTGATNDYVQERVIRSYDVETRTATVSPALTYVPTGTEVTYEIAPLLANAFDIVVALDVASMILGIEGDPKREKSTALQYARKIRTIRLNAAAYESIVGQHFQRDTITNGMVFRW